MIYLAARDAVRVTPTSVMGMTSASTYTFAFTDSKGFQDLGVENILINSSLDGRQATGTIQ